MKMQKIGIKTIEDYRFLYYFINDMYETIIWKFCIHNNIEVEKISTIDLLKIKSALLLCDNRHEKLIRKLYGIISDEIIKRKMWLF